MTGRFHRAARDGYLELLREATKKDCNTPDEDGLTPTSWAAYEGNLDALRLIVLRGGDPDKCDNYGNTALHCAAARGHMSCVSYLVNFETNIFALDNELHTAKDLAAMNNKDDILRYLDSEAAKQEQNNSKLVKKLQEKALKDAEKRKKDFSKIQKKADKKRQDEEKELLKERERIEKAEDKPPEKNRKKSIINTISRGSIAFLNGPRRDSKALYNNNTNYSSPTFSALTTTTNNNKKNLGGIQKKIIKKKVIDDTKNGDFKMSDIEDGRKSVKKISGLKRDSEIIFVGNSSLSSTASSKRGALNSVFNDDMDTLSSNLSRTFSEPDFADARRGSSLFDRPGFGSVAFRPSITATLSSYGPGIFPQPLKSSSTGTSLPEDSLGSSGSLHRDEDSDPWEDQDLPSDEEGEDAAAYLFLAAAGLNEFIPTFTKEKIDLEALMLLTEQDLIGLKLPMGPRRKLLKAIEDRKNAITDPGEVGDSHL